MKNRKLLYVLIPLVLIIWGFVFRQIFFLNKPVSHPIRLSSDEETSEREKNISYKIITEYKDPFLGRIQTGKQEKPSRQNNVSTISRNTIKVPDFKPDLKYYGVIICEDTKVGMVGIKEKLLLVREKSKLNDLYIYSVTIDSLTIKYNEKTFSYFSYK